MNIDAEWIWKIGSNVTTQISIHDDKGSAKGLFWVSWAKASDLSLARCWVIYPSIQQYHSITNSRDSSGWHFLIKALTYTFRWKDLDNLIFCRMKLCKEDISNELKDWTIRYILWILFSREFFCVPFSTNQIPRMAFVRW